MNDINLIFINNNIYNIYGLNGNGKTTILKILAKLLNQSSGNINHNIPQNKISYLSHNFDLFHEKTVHENLTFWLALDNQKFEECYDIVKELKMTNHLDKLYGSLSAGMKKKILIIKAFMKKSNLILLDEPFANLDEKNKKLVENLILKSITDDNIIILTNHTKLDWTTYNYSIGNNE